MKGNRVISVPRKLVIFFCNEMKKKEKKCVKIKKKEKKGTGRIDGRQFTEFRYRVSLPSFVTEIRYRVSLPSFVTEFRYRVSDGRQGPTASIALFLGTVSSHRSHGKTQLNPVKPSKTQ